ncbi:MAG: ABC transporter permease [Candidatus Latescibacterota bacterium]
MLRLLIAKEIRAHLLSYRFAVSFLLLFVLVATSVQVIAVSHARQLAAYTEGQRAQEEKLKEGTDFRSLMWGGSRVEKRPNALGVLAVGLEKEMARSVTISRFQETRLGRSKYANPLFVLFQAPDLSYIVNLVGSLLAVLFAFDAICGEGEQGTLKLVMANSVPRHRVLLAKWIGGYLALILPFVASVLAALLFARLTVGLRFTGPEWVAAVGMLGVAALYISVFYLLSLMISTWVHTSSTSLVINFLVWVILVLLIPNTAPIAARALAPVPSTGVVAGQRQAVQRQVFEKLRPPRGPQGQGRQPENRAERQQRFDQAQAEVREQTDKIMADYLQRVDRQVALGVGLSRLSPSASYVYATAGLAASGLGEFSGLRASIDRYRQEFMQAAQSVQNERMRQAEQASDDSERRQILDAPIDPDALPRFAPGRPGLGEVLTSTSADLLILLALNAVFFLGAYVGFLRYDLMR